MESHEAPSRDLTAPYTASLQITCEASFAALRAVADRAEKLVAHVAGYSITDIDSDEGAMEHIKALRSMASNAEGAVGDFIKDAYSIHRLGTQALGRVTAPLFESVDILWMRHLEYVKGEQAKAEERAKKEEGEQRKALEERAIALAEATGDLGVLDVPIDVPPVASAPMVAKMPARTNYSVTVQDRTAFVRWLLAHPEWMRCIAFQTGAMNDLGKSFSDAPTTPDGVCILSAKKPIVRR